MPDRKALGQFAGKIKEAGLANRVKAIYCSMLNTKFADESFDIIWSEGSISVIGFERGIREWKRFLKPGGFMVIHDEQRIINEKLEQISNCGYELRGCFLLSEDVWWKEYFCPLEESIARSRARYTDDPRVLEEYRQAQGELHIFRRHPERNSSLCFVIMKVPPA